MPSVEIRIDGVDITDDVIISSATFTSQANGQAGTAAFRIKDVPHAYTITNGKRLTLDIGGLRHWTGYVAQVQRVYAFEAASNKPYHARLFQIQAVDINILFTKRIVFKQSDPTVIEGPQYPPGTPDTVALAELMENWLDLSGDDLDTSTFIENVADINADQAARGWSGSYQWGQAMTSLASLPGAVWYIDPDRNVVWTDVDVPNAPHGLSDRPTGDEIGYREMELLKDGTRLVNDFLAVGFGYGSSEPVYSREISTASINKHGLWQASQLVFGVFRQPTIDRIAESVVFGSPSNHRGSKDDRISVQLTIFEPGFRVAMKAIFETEVFGFTDVIPIRQQTITFDGPEYPRFRMILSHEIDPPWGFIDTIGLPGIPMPDDGGTDVPIIKVPVIEHYDTPPDPPLGGWGSHLGGQPPLTGLNYVATLDQPFRSDTDGPRTWWFRGSGNPIEMWEPFPPKVVFADVYDGIRILWPIPLTISILGSIGVATVTAGDAFIRIEVLIRHGPNDPKADTEDEVYATIDSGVSHGGLRFYGTNLQFRIDNVDVQAGDEIRFNVGIQGLVLIAGPSGRIGAFQPGWVRMYPSGWQQEAVDGEHQDIFPGDGVTQTFETSRPFQAGSVTVTINGIVQNGYTTDYQNSTVTFDFVPLPSDQIIIKYVVEE